MIEDEDEKEDENAPHPQARPSGQDRNGDADMERCVVPHELLRCERWRRSWRALL